MIGWLFVGAVVLSLGVLNMPSEALPDMALSDKAWFDVVINTLVVGCIFLCHQCWQKTALAFRFAKVLFLGLSLVLMVAVAVLFALKTLQVREDYERIIPTHTHTVEATVHIQEISDSVYDVAMGTHYRQKAILTDIKPINHLQKSQGTIKDNPFGTFDDEMPKEELPERMTVLLTAFASPKQNLEALAYLTPNTKAKMTLIISPVAEDLRADGFDGGRWLATRHIHANAKIHSIDGEVVSDEQTGLNITLERWRQALRTHFYQNWQTLSFFERQNKAITLSLLTGDRALIDKDTKALYQLGGISHLLAISGTHVVFLALMLAFGCLWVLDKFPNLYAHVSRASFRLGVMVGASMIYALFTGFDVPAVRTVYMLIALAVAQRLALPISHVSMLSAVALVMIWLDPYVLWQAGFWLSFVAVWLLMRYDGTRANDLKERAFELIKLQSWLFVGMLPVSLWLFGKVSLWGLVINLFAVGLFGALIVPINLLAGVLFVVVPYVSDLLWRISGAMLGLLHSALSLIDDTSDVWIYEHWGVAGLCLMVGVILPFVVDGVGKRYAGVSLLALMILALQTPSLQGLSLSTLGTNPAISQLLVRQSGADTHASNEQANWLILADFTGRLTSGQAGSISQTLADALHKQGVSHLTGVVVQTPSPALHEVVQNLSKDIHIHRYWHAGRPPVSALPVLSCRAGELWQGEGLSVKALTGWSDIDDESVWGCSVAFDTQQALVYDDTTLASHDGYELIVNGATHNRLWQLYEMLCHDPSLAPKPTSLWLSHPKAPLSDEIMDRFKPTHIITQTKTLE